MDIIATYTTAITPLIPLFSAVACGILVGMSLQDCLKLEERKLKRVVLIYLLLSGAGWFVTFCYEFLPVLFVWLNIVCLATYILPALFFFRIVRLLTRLGQPENFSPLHYLLPGILVSVMLTWSLFVPFDIQMEIVTGKARVLPAGYEAFARFFTIKPLLRVIFGLVYYLLALRVLMAYYRRAIGKRTRVRKPAKWVMFLVGISLASLFSSVLPTFMPRAEILYSAWTLLVALSIAAQHILLSYHIMRRDYSPYIIKKKEYHQQPKEILAPSNPDVLPVMSAQLKSSRRQYSGELNRKRFEKFIHRNKPYVNPDFKITDLVDSLDVNRTALSAFINRTYGMNFNRYMNRMRLKELAALRSRPENKDKSVSSLIGKVGFKDFRNYSRAVAIEREAASQNGESPKQKGGTK